MARKPVKKQKGNPPGSAGKGKQSKGNIGEEERKVDSAKFEFYDEITRRTFEGEGDGWGRDVAGREGEGRGDRGKRSLGIKRVSPFL